MTYNADRKRLYLHLLVWPYKNVALEGMPFVNRVKYAQFLHDGSEVMLKGLPWQEAHHVFGGPDVLPVILPQMKPGVLIPVVELFLD